MVLRDSRGRFIRKGQTLGGKKFSGKGFEFQDDSQGVLERVGTIMHSNLQSFADSMAERAREKSPVDTGHNKRSIDYQFEGRHSFRIFSESGYGGFLEFGTARMQPRPYFAPAFSETKKEFEESKRWRP